MSDGRCIEGGEFAAPEAWVEKLNALDFEIELPPRDLGPAAGGDFGVRFKHPKVTGDASALVYITLSMESLPRSVPPKVLAIHEKHLNTYIKKDYPTIVVTYKAISVGWAKGGRGGVLEQFKRLAAKGIEVEQGILDVWQKSTARSSQSIEIRSGGSYTFADQVAEDMISWAIAEATGGKLTPSRKGRQKKLNRKNSLLLIEEARNVPSFWEWNKDETRSYFELRPFVSWKETNKEYR